MRRLILIAALVLAGIISASAFLVIDAETDHDSLPAVDRTPGDGDQSEQQEAQDEPQPAPEDDEAEQAATEGEPVEEGSSGEDEEVEVEDPSSEVEDSDQAEDEDRPAEIEEPVESEELDPADVIIGALDIERKLTEGAEPPLVAASAYVVMEGDTLSAIADRFEVPLADLIFRNGLESADMLVVGQKLRLPVSESPSDPLDPPIEVAPGVTDEGIFFGTIEDHERSVINSAVVAIADANREIQFIAACVDGVRRMYVKGLDSSMSPAPAYWRIDLGPLNLDRWTVEDGLVETPRPEPLFDELLDAQMLWLRLGGIDLNFSVESMFPSDIHVNLVHCGQ